MPVGPAETNNMSTNEDAKGAELGQIEDAALEKVAAAPPAEPDAAMVAAEKKIMSVFLPASSHIDHFRRGFTSSRLTRVMVRISRKIDYRLLPILAALYTISLIDRTNLGGARISGIDEAIGLDIGSRYSVVGTSSPFSPEAMDDV